MGPMVRQITNHESQITNETYGRSKNIFRLIKNMSTNICVYHAYYFQRTSLAPGLPPLPPLLLLLLVLLPAATTVLHLCSL